MNPLSSNGIKCILAWAGVLTLTTISPARAVTPVFADNSGGGCNGLLPCFATIQLAVNAASDPDGAGAGAAEVFVFPGVYNESVDLSGMDGGTMGDIQLITVGPTGVPTPGTVRIENTAEAIRHSVNPFTGDVTIDGFVVFSTQQDGIDVTVNGDLVITDVTANFCGDSTGDENGVFATAQSGDVIVVNSTANSTNGDDGFDLDAPAGNITVVNSSADGNDGDGIDIDALGSVTVDGAAASGNGEAGVLVVADGNISVTNMTANGNGLLGISSFSAANISVTNTTANGNGPPGILTSSLANTTFTDVTANNNGGEGFNIDVDGNLVISNATILGNNTQGIEVDEETGGNMVNNVTILNVWVQGNVSDGISLDDLAPAGTHRVNGSIICNNFGDGLDLGAAATVNATANYWGDLSGPTHPGNAGGLGDTVGDSLSTGQGMVKFIPFINTISSGVEPDPALLGSDAEVGFQFSNAAGTVFLGPGPGDRNGDPPFLLTTDNGTLVSSTGAGVTVAEGINNPSGVLTVTLTNAVAGTANISVDPCGLVSSLAVSVETDGDGDGVADSLDGCPADPAKSAAGACGCGVPDTDANGNGTPDCNDVAPPPPPPPPAAGCCAPGVFPVMGLFLPAWLIGWRLRRRLR